MSAARTESRTHVRLAAVAAIVALVGAAWALTSRGDQVSATPTTTVTPEQLGAAAATRLFLGHQSVGANVLDGVPAVYAAAGLTAPPISADDPATSGSGGLIAHAYLGENTQPLGKIDAFDATMRGGMAGKVDMAAMKLCYIDFTAGTDVDALFATYQRTMAALERDYPDVTFLFVTTPLTTQSTGWKARVKDLLGRPDGNAADNVARERYNNLMRDAYGSTGRLFDLAAVESTAADGTRVTGQYDGSTYYALAPQWASDPGHLNAAGAQVAAAALLATVAEAS